MIDKSKTYKTRDGREVRIYATNGGGDQAIHGAVLTDEGWRVHAWYSDGVYARSDRNGHRDLIEVRPRYQRTEWLNVYKHVTHGWYENKLEADTCAGANRIACIKVELDFEEGDGL